MKTTFLDNPTRKNLAKLVHLLCGFILLAFAVAGFLILNLAGGVADKVRFEAERELLKTEFGHQIERVALDQSQISNWDGTLEALGDDIDKRFVRTEIAGWLWADFDIKSSIIVGPDGSPRVTVFKSALLPAESGLKTVTQGQDLINEARELYMKNRVSYRSGFTIEDDPVSSESPIYASDIRIINNEIAILIAQAIVPDDAFVLPDGYPHVLFTYRSMTADDFKLIQNKLGLSSLEILDAGSEPEKDFGSLKMGKSGLLAVWKPDLPSWTIWGQALPLIGCLLFLVAGCLFLVSRRYGSMVSALEESEARNKFLALHDALTGLPNRFQLDLALEEIISNGAQDRCAILCLDLDRFKVVNDTYGHAAGDTVIKTVARRLADEVADSGLAARIGGDEFIVLLQDNLNRRNVLGLCNSIIHSICEEVNFEGGSAQVGASIGVAWWPDDAKTSKMVIRSADEALYRAKNNGRGRAFLAEDVDPKVDTKSSKAA